MRHIVVENLIASRQMGFHSQIGQDRVVAELLGFKREGFFVDIGAHDGINGSNTYFFEEKLGWKGIAFEPNPQVFNKLFANRKCFLENCCVGSERKLVNFLRCSGYTEMLSGILEEYDPRHLQRIDREIAEFGGEKVICEVPQYPFSYFLEKYKLDDIDYLSLDTEGNELKVLSTIPHDKIRIKVLSVENNYGDIEMIKYMIANGYYYLGKLDFDEIFINLK